MAKARAGDHGSGGPRRRACRYEASFARFAAVFPDNFYVKERGRFFPDDSEDKGRLLSAGYHNVMGYWRDDVPLQELILDEKGQKQLDRLWDEFDFIGDHTARTWDQYYFNQSGEVDGKGAESGSARPADKKVSDPEIIFGLRDEYIAKAAQPSNDPAAIEAVKRALPVGERHACAGSRSCALDAEPHHLDALVKFAARAYRRPLTPAERDDLLGYYHSLRDKGRTVARRCDPRFHRQHPDVAEILLSRGPGRRRRPAASRPRPSPPRPPARRSQPLPATRSPAA